MSSAQTDEPRPRRPLRLWPGVVAVVLQWLAWQVVPLLASGTIAGYAVLLGGALGGFAVVVWWLFFSRVRWVERVGAILLMGLAVFATSRIVDVSIRTGGMGVLFYFYAVPVLSLAFVAWAVATCRLSDHVRRASMVATIVLTCGAFLLLRTEGVKGEGGSQFRWRWAKTPEQRLLAQAGSQPVKAPSAPASTNQGAEWPGFRGPDRDGIVHGVRIETDWSHSPPVQIWRRPIGPGWSSFAVGGDVLYTQEQRGEEEVVACYRMSSGEPVWTHRDKVRFWESNAGAGPRGTPTLRHGRVYTFGATGLLNALDAGSGAVIWSRNVASDSDTKVPMWGFSSSPLVVDDVVIVAATGTLLAYDVGTGNRRWSGPTHGGSYSSPHLCTLGGVTQILLLTGAGVTSVNPADGKLLWEYGWEGFTIVQPAVLAEGDILTSTSGATGGLGMRRFSVAQGSGAWTVQTRWTTTGLKPYFNDFVVHKGHAYGFDGSILSCIDLQDGKRQWKGGRYGNGQLVVLADQDVLLVLSEGGELALVGARPEAFKDLARFPAITGKTWNHPALVGDVLLVRNGQEMAAFRLSQASR